MLFSNYRSGYILNIVIVIIIILKHNSIFYKIDYLLNDHIDFAFKNGLQSVLNITYLTVFASHTVLNKFLKMLLSVIVGYNQFLTKCRKLMYLVDCTI